MAPPKKALGNKPYQNGLKIHGLILRFYLVMTLPFFGLGLSLGRWELAQGKSCDGSCPM
jgi:heme/copper-type cytochrome/quinol oxidase subunit 1